MTRSPGTYLICSVPPESTRSCRIVTTDYDIYEKYRKVIPTLQCLADYSDKTLYAEWLKAIDQYAGNLHLLLEPSARDPTAGALCGQLLWAALNKFLSSVVEFHNFLEQVGAQRFVLGSSLHPIVVSLYRDMIESYSGTAIVEAPSKLDRTHIPPAHLMINRPIAKVLNFLSRPPERKGLLFYTCHPPKTFFDLCVHRNRPIHVINPPMGLLLDSSFRQNVSYFFTSLSPKRNLYRYLDRPFSVGQAEVTRTVTALSRKILTEYLASYQQLREELSEWIGRCKPDLAIIGESESAVSCIIHEACQRIKTAVLHVPHGLLPWQGLKTIEGCDNADAILAQSRELEKLYERGGGISSKALKATGSHLPVPHGAKTNSLRHATVLIIEYGLGQIFRGESDRWYYQYAYDLIETHLRKFPNRRILFRMRPYFFKKDRAWMHRFLVRFMQQRDIWSFLKNLLLHGQLESDYLGLGFDLEKEQRLLEYLYRKLPPGSVELDYSVSFYEAARRADYVIGTFSSTFLEAMRLGIPYYCYNPGGLAYPPPLDRSKGYVFDNIDELMDSIDKVSFDKLFEEYVADESDEAKYHDYESVMSLCRSTEPSALGRI